MSSPKTIGFDADDTLWHNERHFSEAHQRFAALLSDYIGIDALEAKLLEIEHKNVKIYGYGIKGFTLSMMESALDVLGDKMDGAHTREILTIGQDLLAMPIELLPHTRTVLDDLARDYELVLITKGDLVDQERKIALSALANYFNCIEIVTEKTTRTYQDIFARHGGAEQAVMVGNSVKSDILPALDAGAWGVHVPYHLICGLEDAPLDENAARLLQARDLTQAAKLIREI